MLAAVLGGNSAVVMNRGGQALACWHRRTRKQPAVAVREGSYCPG